MNLPLDEGEIQGKYTVVEGLFYIVTAIATVVFMNDTSLKSCKNMYSLIVIIT